MDEVVVDIENNCTWKPSGATDAIEVGDHQPTVPRHSSANSLVCELFSDSENELLETNGAPIMGNDEVTILDLRFNDNYQVHADPVVPGKRKGATQDDAIVL